MKEEIKAKIYTMKKEKKTMTEIMMSIKEDERYAQIKDDLRIVLDFVERWNKQDKEISVANSASRLSLLVTLKR